MAGQYEFNQDGYKRRLEREKKYPNLKERYKYYEEIVAAQPTFDTEKEALRFAVEKTKKGERWTVFLAPKELGGKWKAVAWETHEGMAPDAADQLGWCMMYDEEGLYRLAEKDIDNITEV